MTLAPHPLCLSATLISGLVLGALLWSEPSLAQEAVGQEAPARPSSTPVPADALVVGQQYLYQGTWSVPGEEDRSGSLRYIVVNETAGNGRDIAIWVQLEGKGPDPTPKTDSSNAARPKAAEERLFFLTVDAQLREVAREGYWTWPGLSASLHNPFVGAAVSGSLNGQPVRLGGAQLRSSWTELKVEDSTPSQRRYHWNARAGGAAPGEAQLEYLGQAAADLPLPNFFKIRWRNVGVNGAASNSDSAWPAETLAVDRPSAVEFQAKFLKLDPIDPALVFSRRAELSNLRRFIAAVHPAEDLDGLLHVAVMMRERLLGSPYRTVGCNQLEDVIEANRPGREAYLALQSKLETRLETVISAPASTPPSGTPRANDNPPRLTLVTIFGADASPQGDRLRADLEKWLGREADLVVEEWLPGSLRPAEKTAPAGWICYPDVGKAIEALGVDRFPVLLMLGDNRKLLAVHLSFSDGSRASIRSQVRRRLRKK